MYIDFMTEYWYLFAMLFVIILLLSLDPASKGGGSKAISPAQLPPLQTRQHAVVVDLNEKEKFSEGHISQAINIPFTKLQDSIGKVRKYQKKPIVLVCENGNNSRKALSILEKNDFSDVYSLAGGLTAWRKENLPLEKSA